MSSAPAVQSHDSSKNLFLYFFTALAYIPSITFSLLAAEIFPWALIFLTIYIRKTSAAFLFWILYMLLSTSYGLYLNDGADFGEAIRSLAAYLNALGIFLFLIQVDYSFIKRILPVSKFIFYFLIILGFLQAMGAISFLAPLFNFLIPRGNTESLSAIGRGVGLLASEPSRAAFELLFIYLTVRVVYLKPRLHLIYDLFMSLYLLLVIKSGVGLATLAVFLMIMYRLKFLITIFVLSSTLLISSSTDGQRALSIIVTLLNSSSLSEMYFFLLNASGFRLISMISSFQYGLVEIFGGGVGNWKNSSIQAFELTGIDPGSLSFFRETNNSQWGTVRPTSYFFAVMLDMGIIGITLLTGLIMVVIKKFWRISMQAKEVSAMFAFYFLFIGAVGDPVPWIATAISLRYIYNNETNK